MLERGGHGTGALAGWFCPCQRNKRQNGQVGQPGGPQRAMCHPSRHVPLFQNDSGRERKTINGNVDALSRKVKFPNKKMAGRGSIASANAANFSHAKARRFRGRTARRAVLFSHAKARICRGDRPVAPLLAACLAAARQFTPPVRRRGCSVAHGLPWAFCSPREGANLFSSFWVGTVLAESLANEYAIHITCWC